MIQTKEAFQSLTFLLIGAAHLIAGDIQFETEFDTAKSYEKQFVALPKKGESTLEWSAFDAGYGLRKLGPGTINVILDESAEGGQNGMAGTSGSGANASYTDVTVAADVRFVSLNAGSMGLWTRVSEDSSSGYLGLVNVLSENQVRLRIFGEGSSPFNISLGTLLKDETVTTAAPIYPSDVYRLSFSTLTKGNRVEFSLEFRDTIIGQKLAATSVKLSPFEGEKSGQVGFRASSSVMIIDAFSIESTEPQTNQ